MQRQTLATTEARCASRPIGGFVRLVFPNVPGVTYSALAELRGCDTLSAEGIESSRWKDIGTAVDYMLRMKLKCFAIETTDAWQGLRILCRRDFGHLSRVARSFVSQYPELKTRVSNNDFEMARLCLSLGFFDSIRKSGRFTLFNLTIDEFPDWSPEEISEVARLTKIAAESLNHVQIHRSIGNPCFSNQIIGAGGDLIVNDCLLELKVSENPIPEFKNWLYQLLLYVLLDTEDMHQISSVGILLPRQSTSMSWNISDLGISHMPISLLRQVFLGIQRQHAVESLGWSQLEANSMFEGYDARKVLADIAKWGLERCESDE